MIFNKLNSFIFSIFLFLISCNNVKTPKPKDLIPKDTMVNLLLDMHLSNRSRNIKAINGKRKINYFPLIYKKYKIDSSRFKRSHEYYMKELPEYIAIYKKMEDSIVGLLKKDEKQLKIKDSIANSKKKKKLQKLKLDKKLKQKKPFKTLKNPTKK